MSTVIAIKDGDRVYMGSDCIVNKNVNNQSYYNYQNFSIWKSKRVDKALIGYVGSKREADVIKMMDNLITSYDTISSDIDFEFVVTSIVPRIFSDLESNGLGHHLFKRKMKSTFLFAYEDMLWVIYPDGSVMEASDFAVIGSGAKVIKNHLENDALLHPVMSIGKALTKHHKYPIIIGNSGDSHFYLIEKGKTIQELII